MDNKKETYQNKKKNNSERSTSKQKKLSRIPLLVRNKGRGIVKEKKQGHKHKQLKRAWHNIVSKTKKKQIHDHIQTYNNNKKGDRQHKPNEQQTTIIATTSL